VKLLLWDIDGTLLHTSGAGLRALEKSTDAEFELGESAYLSDIDWAGRTDRWISQLILEKYDQPHTAENVARLLTAYIERLPTELSVNSKVLPGIEDILQAAHERSDVCQGLLTGNLEIGAKTKLGYFGLWDYFPFGAFADDSAQRNDLGPHALRRAQEHTGHTFATDDVWIIGDTPHDIACGKVIGARTLAVATGHHTLEQLKPHEPDVAMADLSQPGDFWSALGLPAS